MFLVSLFGEPCLLDIQCSAITTGAICAIIEQNKNGIVVNKKDITLSTVAKNKVCSKEDYYKFGRCFKKRCKTE